MVHVCGKRCIGINGLVVSFTFTSHDAGTAVTPLAASNYIPVFVLVE